MGFGGQTGLTALKFTLKSVFIDRKIIADSRNRGYNHEANFLTEYSRDQKIHSNEKKHTLKADSDLFSK